MAHVWVSTVMTDSMLIMPVDTDIFENEREKAIAGERLLTKGEPVPAGMCPRKIWGEADAEPYRRFEPGKIPEVFSAKGQWIVSSRAASVLRQFDLGGGALYPVDGGLWESDQKTRIPGEYFVWVFGNSKQAFLPDDTPEKRRFGVSGIRWNFPWVMSDDNVAVSSTALPRPDVWLDPGLFKAIFLSAALGDALDSARLKEAFNLYRCRVIRN